MNRNPSAMTMDDPTKHIGTLYAATEAEIEDIVLSPHTMHRWLVLGNGELCLAIFPQDDYYEALTASLNLDNL